VSKYSVDIGFWFGIALMAVVTFVLNWFVYTEIKHQRDYWMLLYCEESVTESSFCDNG